MSTYSAKFLHLNTTTGNSTHPYTPNFPVINPTCKLPGWFEQFNFTKLRPKTINRIVNEKNPIYNSNVNNPNQQNEVGDTKAHILAKALLSSGENINKHSEEYREFDKLIHGTGTNFRLANKEGKTPLDIMPKVYQEHFWIKFPDYMPVLMVRCCEDSGPLKLAINNSKDLILAIECRKDEMAKNLVQFVSPTQISKEMSGFCGFTKAISARNVELVEHFIAVYNVNPDILYSHYLENISGTAMDYALHLYNVPQDEDLQNIIQILDSNGFSCSRNSGQFFQNILTLQNILSERNLNHPYID